MPRGKAFGKGAKCKDGKGKGGKGKGGNGAAMDVDGGAGYVGYSYDYIGYESHGYYLVFASNLGMLCNFLNSATLSPIPNNF